MSGAIETDRIVRLFGEAGVESMFTSDVEERAERVRRESEEVEREIKRRFGSGFCPSLLEKCLAEPEAMMPLIQSFAAPMTAPVRAMIYCVLMGASIERLSYEYEAGQKTHLSVQVKLPTGERSVFDSDEIWDAEVLRHVGLAKKGGRPLLDGYYAFRRGA